MPMNTQDRQNYVMLLHIAAAVVVICLFGMTVMLMCVVFTPRIPSFEVTSLTVTPTATATAAPLNATARQKQTVTFHFQGLMENPNAVLAVWYKNPNLLMWFEHSSVASVPLEAPHLAKGVPANIPFQVEFTVDNKKVLRELAAKRRVFGSVNFGITFHAWIKFKFGGINSKPRFLSFNCQALQVGFSPVYNVNNESNIGMLVDPIQCEL